jgi:hypothetical protein
MPYMNPIDTGFEPGQTTKTLIYYVNKKKSQIGSTPQQGLIQDEHFTFMLIFFVIALVLEVIGLMFIIDAIALGFWHGLMSVSFLIILDITFAFLFHLKTKTICRCENELVVLSLTAPDRVQTRAAHLRSKISKAKTTGILLAILIWLIAATKIIAFYSLKSVSAAGVDTETMFIIVTYLIVALIHIYCTGYALFGLFARFSWWANEKSYIKGRQPGASISNVFTAQTRLEDIVTRSPIPAHTQLGKHALEKLVQVDLVWRDATDCGRVVLGRSVLDDLRTEKTSEAETEIMREKNVPRAVLYPQYKNEIETSVQKKIDELLKVKINLDENKGILEARLIAYLQAKWAIKPETLNDLTYGQSLYRLTTVGLLFDHDLAALADQTPDLASKNEIALHGLHVQLHQLQLPADI